MGQSSQRPIRRVAMMSVHTSPLEQPGSGDAGGLNVYVVQTAKGLAKRDIEVEIFTRATASHQPPSVELAPGIVVRHVAAGPFEGLAKEDLPGQLCAFTAGVLHTEAWQEPGWYDLVHSHYWLSGLVGWLAADRWWVPQVHTMHTLGKVKNLALADTDKPEPMGRLIGEQQVVEASDQLLANSALEARDLVALYGAPPEQVSVVTPGVDLEVFSARPQGKALARQRLGLAPDALVVLFVGRIQPLKAPDVVVRAVAQILAAHPQWRSRLVVPIVGGPSGSGLADPEGLPALVRELGLEDVVTFHPPADRDLLVQWYRAADVLAMPSHNETFGLVALEAQACGTPVVAAAVGGLSTAVQDGVSGVLVNGHDPAVWAQVLTDVLNDPQRRDAMGRAGLVHASGFSWDATIDQTLAAYERAQHIRQERILAEQRPAGQTVNLTSGKITA